jgi:hypothetical protein
MTLVKQDGSSEGSQVGHDHDDIHGLPDPEKDYWHREYTTSSSTWLKPSLKPPEHLYRMMFLFSHPTH